MATTKPQTDIAALAERFGYYIETHEMVGGKVWDVRIYPAPDESGASPSKHPVTGQRMVYNRRRDVLKRDIPRKIAQMLAERAVPGVTAEDAGRLTLKEATALLERVAPAQHPHGTYDPRATYVVAETWSENGWGVSYSQATQMFVPGETHDIDPTVTLSVSRVHFGVDHPEIERHPDHHGRTFPTMDAAHQYTLDHGLIRLWRAATPQPEPQADPDLPTVELTRRDETIKVFPVLTSGWLGWEIRAEVRDTATGAIKCDRVFGSVHRKADVRDSIDRNIAQLRNAGWA